MHSEPMPDALERAVAIFWGGSLIALWAAAELLDWLRKRRQR